MSGFALRTSMAGVVGGSASELGGGKFANGAVTAAFVHMFNAEAGNILAKANEIKRLTNLSKRQFTKEMDFNGSISDIEILKLKLSIQIRDNAILEDLPAVGKSGVKVLMSAVPVSKIDAKSMPSILDFFTPSPSNLRFEYNCHLFSGCGVKIYE